MNQEGWIKIHRKMWDNPRLQKPAYLAVWLRLLCEASHTEKIILWKGEKITIKPGQLTCGTQQLAGWCGVPRGTVTRILKCFENEQQIEQQTSNRFSLITIKNWHKYQFGEHQNDQQMNNKRTSSEHPVNTPKECKKERIKEITYDQNFEKFWIEYPKKVGKKKAHSVWKRMSQHEKQNAIAALPSHIKCDQWMKDGGQFIPHPATWLNQGRWEDSVTVSVGKRRGEYGELYESLSESQKQTIKQRINGYLEKFAEMPKVKQIDHWINTEILIHKPT